MLARQHLSHLIPSPPPSIVLLLLPSHLVHVYPLLLLLLGLVYGSGEGDGHRLSSSPQQHPIAPSLRKTLYGTHPGCAGDCEWSSQRRVDSRNRVDFRHCQENYFHDETGRWTKGFESNQGTGLLLASVGQALVYLGSPLQGMNVLIDLLQHESFEVREGATLGVGLVCCMGTDPRDDLPLNVLMTSLSAPLSKADSQTNQLFSASILALALAYPGTQKQEILPFLIKGIIEGSFETMGVSSLAGGLIFAGSRNLGFGLSLLYTVSLVPRLSPRIKK